MNFTMFSLLLLLFFLPQTLEGSTTEMLTACSDELFPIVRGFRLNLFTMSTARRLAWLTQFQVELIYHVDCPKTRPIDSVPRWSYLLCRLHEGSHDCIVDVRDMYVPFFDLQIYAKCEAFVLWNMCETWCSCHGIHCHVSFKVYIIILCAKYELFPW